MVLAHAAGSVRERLDSHLRSGNMKRVDAVRFCAYLASVLAIVAVAFPAVAQAPICHLLNDESGDAREYTPGIAIAPNEPDVDILSGDLASDAKNVTTVIRVANLGSALQAAPRRTSYEFFFRLGKSEVITIAARSLDGESFSVLVDDPESTDVTGIPAAVAARGVFDLARNEVRVTLPLSQASGHRAVGAKATFDHLEISASRGLGTNRGGALSKIDQATSTRTYRSGAPSCVRPGF